MKKFIHQVQNFSNSSTENKTQTTLIAGFILLPIVAMLALFVLILI